MYLLLLFCAIGCFKLIPYLKDQAQFLHLELKSKRKYHQQLREEWRELITQKPEPSYSYREDNEVPDFLKEETAALKKDVLELSAIVSELKPINHAQN